MAVKVLCLASDGSGGRKRGAIIHIQDGPTLDSIKLGVACGPPAFFVLNFPDKYAKDLPKEWLEYGGHESRVLIEADKLDAESVSALSEDACCELDLDTVKLVQKDQGVDWSTSAVAEVPK